MEGRRLIRLRLFIGLFLRCPWQTLLITTGSRTSRSRSGHGIGSGELFARKLPELARGRVWCVLRGPRPGPRRGERASRAESVSHNYFGTITISSSFPRTDEQFGGTAIESGETVARLREREWDDTQRVVVLGTKNREKRADLNTHPQRYTHRLTQIHPRADAHSDRDGTVVTKASPLGHGNYRVSDRI